MASTSVTVDGGTVVARWTAGQQVEHSILLQDLQNSSHSSRLFPVQSSLTVQKRGLKHHSFIPIDEEMRNNCNV